MCACSLVVLDFHFVVVETWDQIPVTTHYTFYVSVLQYTKKNMFPVQLVRRLGICDENVSLIDRLC